jgi:hypothetical protein
VHYIFGSVTKGEAGEVADERGVRERQGVGARKRQEEEYAGGAVAAAGTPPNSNINSKINSKISSKISGGGGMRATGILDSLLERNRGAPVRPPSFRPGEEVVLLRSDGSRRFARVEAEFAVSM